MQTRNSVATNLAAALKALVGGGRERVGPRGRRSGAVRRGLDRSLRVFLALALLSHSTPAAPRVIAATATEWQSGAAIWLQTSTLMSRLRRLLAGAGAATPRRQEEQSARDVRVNRIRISPGDVKIFVGERVFFAAVAYDQEETPVGGVRFTWSARHGARDRHLSITQDGAFTPRTAGTYQITVEGAGRRAQVTAVVRQGEQPADGRRPKNGKGGANAPAPRRITTRALPSASSSLRDARPNPKRPTVKDRAGAASIVKTAFTKTAAPAAAPMPLLPDYGWDDGNYWAADDPGNSTGDPPGGAADGGAGSGNFQLAAPVVGLPGRGIDLSLGLFYNSRVWNKAGSEFTFDIDRDWPAPGWSLGFGKMIRMGNQGGSLLVDADGTRHGFHGGKDFGFFNGHTSDGTFIDYWSIDDGFGGLLSGEARLPNGTVVQYGARNQNVIYPTRITDANGNFITITYRNHTGPQLDSVTDTMGRVVQFHYDANNFLTAVTAPDLTSGSRTLVRLRYRQHALGYSFAGTTRVRDGAPWVIDSIYYPATATGYFFGEANSYSSYGMIAAVSERRGMGFTASSLNEQGTLTNNGVVTKQEVYDYPLAPTPSTPLSNAPTFGKMTATWEGMDTAAAETFYSVQQDATPRRAEVKMPDNTKSIQLSYNFSSLPDSHPDKFKDGLVYYEETRDANNNLLRSSTVEWAQGDYESPRPVRNETTNHEIGKKTATTYEYGPRNQVTFQRDYDFADPAVTPTVLLRTTAAVYENAPMYLVNRHIYNLPKKVEVFAGDGARLSLTEYQYDAPPLELTPGVVQHDPTYDPSSEEQCGYEPDQNDPDYQNGPTCQMWDPQSCDGHIPQVWVCHPVYNSFTDTRGNVTKVTTYTGPATDPAGGAIEETRTYDITGNAVKVSSSCCEQTSLAFTAATQFAYPTSTTRGASAANSPLRITTHAAYDFNTGLLLSATDAEGRISQTSYDPASLRPHEELLPTGGSTTYDYDDVGMAVTKTIRLASGGEVAAKSVVYLNGMGMVRREEALGAPQAATWAGSVLDVVETKFDKMGRVWQQSRPYRNGAETPQWTVNSYDALGRLWKAEAPDGSETRAYFNDLDPAHPRPNAASGAPGETSLVVDPWGRERWVRTDSRGQLVEVVEPNPNGSGGVTTGGLPTTYGYDALGRLTDVVQGVQHRRFSYDGLGRLVRQKLAETTAVFNDAGQYVGPGHPNAAWSELFAYDDHSNIVSRADARNVLTSYSYDHAPNSHDPLNRLHAVSYTVQTGTIAAADSVSYEYPASGDLTRVMSVTTKEPGTNQTRTTEAYRYDAGGRVDQKTVTLASRPGFSLVTNYVYDNLDRVTDVIYPRQYPSTTRKTVHHDYDVASRLGGVTVDGAAYASQMEYNAASQAKTLKVGAAGANQVTEAYVYDAATGLLTGQKAHRGADDNTKNLLHLSYDYLRPNTTSGRTGQLTKMTDHLNPEKGRAYTYDPLGRLKHVGGGDPAAAALWTQDYSYDNYGNRTGVVAAGDTASLKAPADPSPKLPDVELAANSLPNVPESLREKSERSVTDAPAAPLLSAAAAKGLSPPVFAPGAPTNLSITASSATQVSMSWTAPAGGAAHYAVERGLRLTGSYTNVGTVAGNQTTFNDTSVVGGTAYLYRVRAVDGLGSRSAPSNVALGAAFTFTDNPLVANTTAIKAQHFNELRQAVNAVRVAAGLNAATWTDATLTTQATQVRAVHVQELRDRLNEALAALQISSPPFTDPVLGTGAGGTAVKRAHVAELRQRAGSGQSASTGGAPGGPVPRDGFDTLSYEGTSNRINSAGWEYDAAGNQTRVRVSDTVWRRYAYDAANRLVAVKTDGEAVLASYTYGASNARLISHEGSSRTYYSWGGGEVVTEYTEADGTSSANSPQWGKSYVYLGGRLLATQQPVQGGESVEYHHPDRLGTRVVSNGYDQTFYEQAHLPFGGGLPAETTGDTSRRFTSYERSELTLLDYAVNRHYDSRQGRFTQVDPIGMRSVNLNDPQSLNLYAYCTNDPVNHSDPDGLGFLGFLKKLFKGIGKVLSAVGRAIAKVLNNRWVQIAMFALDFILPGLGKLTSAFGKALYRIANIAVKVYQRANEIAGLLQLSGMLLEGKFREFGRAIALGFVGGLYSMVTQSIKNGIQGALFGGNFDELGDLFSGAWKGFKEGLERVGNYLKAIGEHGLKAFFSYGYTCGRGTGDTGGAHSTYYSGYEEACKGHDSAIGKANSVDDVLRADRRFLGRILYGPLTGSGVHAWDYAFAGRGYPSVGAVSKFFAIHAFTVLVVTKTPSVKKP